MTGAHERRRAHLVNAMRKALAKSTVGGDARVVLRAGHIARLFREYEAASLAILDRELL